MTAFCFNGPTLTFFGLTPSVASGVGPGGGTKHSVGGSGDAVHSREESEDSGRGSIAGLVVKHAADSEFL